MGFHYLVKEHELLYFFPGKLNEDLLQSLQAMLRSLGTILCAFRTCFFMVFEMLYLLKSLFLNRNFLYSLVNILQLLLTFSK